MTTDTIRATLPPPSVGAARDGGLGYSELFDRNGFTTVTVGPLMKIKPGEFVTINWDGNAIMLYSVTAEDLELGTFPIDVSNGKIADAGDGDKLLSYTATYTQGGGQEFSEAVLVKVKRTIPGGLDPSPGTPDFNENLVAATVSPNPVPPDAESATVHIPLWINPAIGDVAIVSWNGATFPSPYLTQPFPEVVGITLTAAQILAAGVGPAIPVTWGVHDVVSNWSAWAKETPVEVRLEDPGRFLAPRVGDKDHPWTDVDLASLGSSDVAVFVPTYDGALKGDTVVVHATGMNLGGETIAFDCPPQIADEPAFGLTFTLPNATAVALAGGNLRVWYDVQQGAGEPSPSRSVWLRVLGEAAGNSPAPIVVEATDTDGDGLADRLDPDKANPAHVTIDYPSMALYDTVTLILDGRTSGGAPVRFQLERQINTVEPLSFSVPQVEIVRFLGGSVDVYYQLAPFSKRSRAFIRALSQQESDRLALSVRREVAELPLPAPTVKDDKGRLIGSGGLLDPANTEAILEAAVYLNIAIGDEITYRWLGTGSTRTKTYKVTDPAKPPADHTDRNFIVQNNGGKVVVSYSVRRLGVGNAVPSEMASFTIRSPFWAVDFTRQPLRDIPYGTSYRMDPITITAIPGTGRGLIILGNVGGTDGLNVGGFHYDDGSDPIGGRVALELASLCVCIQFTVTGAEHTDTVAEFYRGDVLLATTIVPGPLIKTFRYENSDGFDRVDFRAPTDWFVIFKVTNHL